jgi:hypothetical protein
LPASYEISQVYETLDSYGLCVKDGVEVPFVKVDVEQSASRSNPLSPPPEFLPKQTTESQAPRGILAPPPEYIKQPSTTTSPEGEAGIGGVMAFALGVFFVGRVGYRYFVTQAPSYQEIPQDDSTHEIYEDDRMTTPTPARVPVLAEVRREPSPWGHMPETLATQGISPKISPETGGETGLKLTEIATETALQATETRLKLTETEKSFTETPLQPSASFSEINRVSPEISARADAMFSSIRSRLNNTLLLDVDESIPRETRNGIVRGDLDIDSFDQQVAYKLFVSLKENNKTDIGWGIFGLTPNGGRKWATASALIDEWNNNDETTAR